MKDTSFDVLSWMPHNLKIIDKAGNLIPLVPNIAQLKVHNTLELQRVRGLPMRVLIVKARQEGVSTYFAARIFEEINRRKGRTGQLVSADLDSTNEVFTMSRRFQEEMPDKLPTDYSNKKEIIYSKPHGSRLMLQTAGKDVLGRGGTRHYFHGSEVAFWPDAKQGLIGALQQVAKIPDTIVALESTGNGVGGEFCDRYVQAVDQRRFDPNDYTGFLPIFLSWQSFPEYTQPLKGYKLEPHTDHEMYGDEKELVAKFELTPEQLYWRRWTIKSECGGDLVYFMQEYPMTWQESFQSSGRSVFNQAMLNRLPVHDGRTAEFDGLKEPKIKDVERQLNCWTIWQLVRPDHEYTLGIDSAEGVVCDSSNPRSDPDFHAALIYDRTANEVVATYLGRGEQRDFGLQCYQAAIYYNNAWTAPELPFGMVVLDIFKQNNFPRIYNRQTHDDYDESEETEALGWKTTTATRPVMVEQLCSFLRESPPKIYSADLVNQMRTFVRDKNGKAIHQPGCHDDLIFAFMIAIQLHLRSPMSAAPYGYATTFEAQLEPARRGTDIAYSGAIDTFQEENDDDDYYLPW